MALVEKFNYQTGEFERVPEDWTLQYNYGSGKWEYAPPGSSPRFNYASGEFEMRDAGATPQYNPGSGSFEMAESGWDTVYDYGSGKWVKRPKKWHAAEVCRAGPELGARVLAGDPILHGVRREAARLQPQPKGRQHGRTHRGHQHRHQE